MDAKQLFAGIDQLQNEYVQFWVDICNIESPTGYKPGVDAVGRYFIERAEKRGWNVEVHKEAVSGDAVCITMNPNAPGKPVCFSGHMDTIHPVGSFGTAANVVPDTCEIVIDVRYFTLEDMEKADQIIRDIAAKSFLEGSCTEIADVRSRPPMEKTERNMRMLQRLNEIYESVGLPVLEATWSSGGSDGADMTTRGITVVDALGVCGKGIHSLREQAVISSLAECAKRLASVAAFL